jgi:O-antigen/teichoic acid export membrane protein
MGSYWTNTFLLEGRPALVARTTWAGTGVCLIGYALLIPRHGTRGAIEATLLGFGTIAALAFLGSQRVRPFGYEYARWGKIIACAAAAVVPSAILRPTGFWPQAGLGAGCFGLFLALLVAARLPTVGEWRAAGQLLKRAERKTYPPRPA